MVSFWNCAFLMLISLYFASRNCNGRAKEAG
jgi:hypothetical protein